MILASLSRLSPRRSCARSTRIYPRVTTTTTTITTSWPRATVLQTVLQTSNKPLSYSSTVYPFPPTLFISHSPSTVSSREWNSFPVPFTLPFFSSHDNQRRSTLARTALNRVNEARGNPSLFRSKISKFCRNGLFIGEKRWRSNREKVGGKNVFG